MCLPALDGQWLATATERLQHIAQWAPPFSALPWQAGVDPHGDLRTLGIDLLTVSQMVTAVTRRCGRLTGRTLADDGEVSLSTRQDLDRWSQ